MVLTTYMTVVTLKSERISSLRDLILNHSTATFLSAEKLLCDFSPAFIIYMFPHDHQLPQHGKGWIEKNPVLDGTDRRKLTFVRQHVRLRVADNERR
ncbi:hypothetical protein RRG08_025526 [Elysia crispata]|uniref:Uncharacterized protein n=1 Tax=Elysia crispata TaxID=231223 RepID=A0AAE1A1L8_9GAST|nr:hypothetical protein RRG08_025526 [Elysia crispata]